MSRKSAREIAFHIIFEMGFNEFEAETILVDRLDETIMNSISSDIELYAGSVSENDKTYITSVVKGVVVHLSELDELIKGNLKNWNVSRISRVAMALMRLSIYEIKYVSDVPAAVSINEVVELSKKYDLKETTSFINGVLGVIARAEQD